MHMKILPISTIVVTLLLPVTSSLESEESCKVLSQKCFTDTQISENPQVTVCKSGSSLEDFGNIPTDKNYCEIQPDQSIGEKTWAECDNDCPTETNHGSAVHCRTRPVACQFPFLDGNGDLHYNCTYTKLMMDYYYSDSDYYENNPNENVPFLWCATKTTEDYGMIFWGKCDEKSCFPQEISTTMIPTISSTTTSTTSIPIVTTTTMTSKPTTSVSGEGQKSSTKFRENNDSESGNTTTTTTPNTLSTTRPTTSTTTTTTTTITTTSTSTGTVMTDSVIIFVYGSLLMVLFLILTFTVLLVRKIKVLL